jgi:hypothetical protein
MEAPIMNEWAEREGKQNERAIIDLTLAHVPTGRAEGGYNRAAYIRGGVSSRRFGRTC